MTNIVVPMAGSGSRFAKAGYTTPKPFIDVGGKPMIEAVVDNLSLPHARFILLVQKNQQQQYREVFDRLSKRYPITIRSINRLTEGPASTVFLAADLINTGDRLIIANSDQLVDVVMADYVEDSDSRGLDGSILTFPSEDPKWSYAALNSEGLVREVKEKVVISPNATVGIYYFRRGSDFISGAAIMMAKGDKTNQEFYVCPVYNHLLAMRKKIGIFQLAVNQMHGLGTPADLAAYMVSKQPRTISVQVHEAV